MNRDADAPIIVSGIGRSGSTWVQWFLSQHPRIHVHGQPPNVHWTTFWDWCRTLVEQGEWAQRANREIGYQIAHYAGSDGDRARKIFRRAFRLYMTGYGPHKPRWGLKWIGFCANPTDVCQFTSLWPETCWVVCVRDPFRTIASAKNTFVPGLDVREYAARWVRTCKFIESCDPRRVAVVQMDKLNDLPAGDREGVMRGVLARLGESPCRQTDEFARRWEVVHKVTPDESREFVLSDEEKRALLEEVPELAVTMERMGYGSAVRAI